MLEDSKNAINEHQIGGMLRSSPVLALLKMSHTWLSALEDPKSDTKLYF